jgi:hypothetical protein
MDLPDSEFAEGVEHLYVFEHPNVLVVYPVFAVLLFAY